MLVVDYLKSERGPQRKRASDGRLLHCCCVCGALDVWGNGWSVYCSELELDEGVAVPKFCSTKCKRKGGETAENVTVEMRMIAKEAEMRAPEFAYRAATEREKYKAALSRQRPK